MSMSLGNIAILDNHGADYRYIISGTSKSYYKNGQRKFNFW